MKTKILVISDTHGFVDPIDKIIERQRPDYIFFLGDSVRDMQSIGQNYQYLPICKVLGNNDFFSYDKTARDEKLIDIDNVKFLLTHGHKYHVKSTLEYLKHAAREKGAQYVFFGHTHKTCDLYENGIYYLNPGSFRDSGSYIIVEVEQNKVRIFMQHI